MTEQLGVRYQVYVYTKPRIERWVEVVTLSGDDGIGHLSRAGIYADLGSSDSSTRIEFSAQRVEEAIQTAEDIDALPAEEALVMRTYYLQLGSNIAKAVVCRCSPAALFRRLDRAHERLYIKWFGKVGT